MESHASADSGVRAQPPMVQGCNRACTIRTVAWEAQGKVRELHRSTDGNSSVVETGSTLKRVSPSRQNVEQIDFDSLWSSGETDGRPFADDGSSRGFGLAPQERISTWLAPRCRVQRSNV